MNDAALNDAVTIVLTLKDRSPFTYRWMRYMNDLGCRYPILIADGGEDPEVEARLRATENFPRLRYTYLRLPQDRGYQSYYDKLANSVDRVTTPYVMLADNDDFILLDAVDECARCLDERPTVVTCGGQRLELRLLADQRLVGEPQAPHYEVRPDLRPKAIRGSSAVERLAYFLEQVQPLYLWSCWYGVHRRLPLASALGAARMHEFRDPVTHETHVHLALLCHGEYEEIGRPAFVNQAGSSQLTAELQSRGNVIERLVARNGIADFHHSLDTIGDALRPGDRDRLHRSLAVWLACYAAKCYGPPRRGRRARSFGWLSTKRPMRLPVLEPFILTGP